MAMFQKVEEPVKFWAVQDGVVGTAHMGRDGGIKDFRPARGGVNSFSSGNRFVNFRPAKGVEVVPSEVEVAYGAVAVEYRPDAPPVVTWRKNRYVADDAIYQHMPETVVEVFENSFGAETVVYGFPPPEWKAAEIETARSERAAKAVADVPPAPVSRKEFLAWAEAQTGQVRRWLRRLAAVNKAGDQVYRETRRAFPGRQVQSAGVLREWLTEDK